MSKSSRAFYSHKDGIGLAALERSDLPLLTQLKRESWWGTHHLTIATEESQSRWFDSIGVDELYLLAVTLDDRFSYDPGAPVGLAVYTGIDCLNRSLRISGSIFEEKRKPEVVSAAFSSGFDFAFEMLNVRRVEAEVLASNRPAQKVEIDHLGFVVEGVRREAVYKCGQYFDSIQLGMLRSEWEASPRVESYEGCCNTDFNPRIAQRSASRWSKSTLGD